MSNELVWTCIRDIRPGMKNLNVQFIVLEIGKPTQTKDGHVVRSVKIGDRSGCVNMSVWDTMGEIMQPGDICRVTKGYGSIWKGSLTLYAGKGGEMEKIGEFCMLFAEIPNMSDPQAEFLQKPAELDVPLTKSSSFANITTAATPTPESSNSIDSRKNFRPNGTPTNNPNLNNTFGNTNNTNNKYQFAKKVR